MSQLGPDRREAYKQECEARFAAKSKRELVQCYARECGNPGWVSARAIYLHALRNEMTQRLDCRQIIHESGGLYLSNAKITLRFGKVIRRELPPS
jgi:hypothetical protein